MSGVCIGDGAVVACNSLTKIQWWKWSPEKINENVYLLCNDRIDEFIDKHKDNDPFVT